MALNVDGDSSAPKSICIGMMVPGLHLRDSVVMNKSRRRMFELKLLIRRTGKLLIHMPVSRF